MDSIDIMIINALEQNSRATASQISKEVNMSVPAVAERIRKLEESGIIEQFTIRLNRKMMGLRLMAVIFVNIDYNRNIDSFRNGVAELSEVIECHHMAGEYDYLLKVLVEDTEALEDFISDKLKRLPGVAMSNTVISLSTIKDTLNRRTEYVI